MVFGSSYSGNVYDPPRLRSIVRLVHKKLKWIHKYVGSFEAIAFRGMSGAAVAYSLSAFYNYNLIMVRKPQDGQSHSSSPIEGTSIDVYRYVIIDDFIDRGDTLNAIVETINEYVRFDKVAAVPLAAILYNFKQDEGSREVKGYNVPIYGLWTEDNRGE